MQILEFMHHSVPQFTQSCSKNPTHALVLHVQPNTCATHVQANSTALALRAAGTEVRELIVRADERHQEEPTAGTVAVRPVPAAGGAPASPINAPGSPKSDGGDDIVTDHEAEGQEDDGEGLGSDVDGADADGGVDGEMQGVETASDVDSGDGEGTVSGSDSDEDMQTIEGDGDEDDDSDEEVEASGVAEDREGIAQPPGGTGVPKRQRQDTLMSVLGGGARGAAMGKGGPVGKHRRSATAASSGVSTVSAIETEPPAKKKRRVPAAGSGKAKKTPETQKKPEKEKRRPAVAGSKENKKQERTKKTKTPPSDKGKANRLRSKKPLQDSNV